MDEGIGGIGGGGGGGCKAVLAVSASYYCCVVCNGKPDSPAQHSQTGISALHNTEHSTYTGLWTGEPMEKIYFYTTPHHTTPPHIWDHTAVNNKIISTSIMMVNLFPFFLPHSRPCHLLCIELNRRCSVQRQSFLLAKSVE